MFEGPGLILDWSASRHIAHCANATCGDRNGRPSRTTAEVARLERDHDEADQHHGVVDTLVRRWLVRGHLEADEARELRERLTALRVIYEQHIKVEDRELFPTAARLLSASEIKEMGCEMAARRLPPAKTRNRSDQGIDT